MEKISFPEHSLYQKYGYKIEVRVHTFTSVRELFLKAKKYRNPTFLRLFVDSFTIIDAGNIKMEEIKNEAREILSEGPSPLSIEELETYRYKITNNLTDMENSNSLQEKLYILSEIQVLLYKLILLKNNRWLGEGKHLFREMNKFNPELCRRFITSTKKLLFDDNCYEFVSVVDQELTVFGGRLKESIRLNSFY